MKKTLLYISLAVLSISCVKEQLQQGQEIQKQLVAMEFNAATENVQLEQAKSSLATDGVSVLWIAGDKVLVFDGSNVVDDSDNGVVFTAQSSGSRVVISGNADPAVEEYYAIYPSASGKMSLDNVFTSKIASQQIVTAGTMADDCAVMIAKASDVNMHFKNVTALVEFNLQVDGVRSLTLIGNNNEKITGAFTAVWNDGNPIATPGAAEVTATLRAQDNADLAKGKYYFTILPTDFTKGFSVILGMNDGTQKVVNRNAAVNIGRNQIFCTQDVPEHAIKAHSSNFVKYNDGFDLTYAHLTINKAGNSNKYATYVNDGKGKISSAGVYFVGPESQNVDLAVLGTTGFVVAADNPAVRSVIKTQSKAIQAQEKTDGYIILSGLDIQNSPNQIILQQTEAKGGFANFGSIVIDNCKLVLSENMVNCHNRGMSLANFVLQDSDVLINASKENSYMFNCGSQISSVASVKFINNVFHNGLTAETGDVQTNFRLVNAASASVCNLTVTNNTLSNLKVGDTNGCVYTSSLTGEVNATSNFFVNFQTKDKTYLIYSASASETMSYNVKDNFYYTSNWDLRLWAIGIPTASNQGTKVNSVNPSPFIQYPLSADWDPQNGVFGYVEGLKYGKLVTSDTPYTVTETGGGFVSSYRGAQRKTAPAVLNQAGIGYGDKELGNI